MELPDFNPEDFDDLQQWERERQRLERLLPELRPEEATVVQAALERPESRAKLLAEEVFEREPVSLRQFVYDDYYLGRSMRGQVFDGIVDDLEELFASDYSEVVLGGGIGWGKTRWMQIGISYDLYRVTTLRDPARAYGMITGSNLTFVNISVDRTQANNVLFRDLYTLLSGSPYFNEVATFDRNLKRAIRFHEKNIWFYPVAASERAALGTGVFAAVLDEANFWDVVARSKRATPGEVDLYDQAEAVFHKLSSRMRSRMTQRGRLPGHIYVASSARYPDDFVERLMRKAREEAERGEHHIFTRRYPTWGTRPPGKYRQGTFKVEVGDFTRRSRVLHTKHEEESATGQVIEVPLDFERDFEHDPDRAVRDLAGISVHSIRPFFSNREKVARLFAMGEAAGLQHPFSRETVTLQEEDLSLERLRPEYLHWVKTQRVNPATGLPVYADGQPVMEEMLFPAVYYAHIDLSKTGDATGLVICHTIGPKKVSRFSPEEIKNVEETKPIMRVDLVLRVVAPKYGEIDIPRVRAVLYQLNRQCGMQFGKVTFDTYASQESVKALTDEGFNADILSIDKDMTAYEILRTAIYDERVLCYRNSVLERELIQLERGERKVDHPATHGGSKDLADALAGAIFNCEEGWRRGESARGIFQVGVVDHPGQLPPSAEERWAQVNAKILQDVPLTGQDENHMLFGDL